MLPQVQRERGGFVCEACLYYIELARKELQELVTVVTWREAKQALRVAGI
jgi:hypothetical protein